MPIPAVQGVRIGGKGPVWSDVDDTPSSTPPPPSIDDLAASLTTNDFEALYDDFNVQHNEF